MIDRKFLFFKNRKTFEDALRQGEINRRESIVFIKGETENDRAIWTHGVYYEPTKGLEHSKGFFESYQALYNVYHWPAIGDWAIVATEAAPWVLGDKLPATFGDGVEGAWVIYTCEQTGVWKQTSRIYDREGIDLSEYLKRDEIDLNSFVTKDQLQLDKYLTKTEAEDTYANISTVTSALSLKQNRLVSGENIKTINGQSILGPGNIPVVQTINIDGTEQVDLTQLEQDIQELKDAIDQLNNATEDQEYIYMTFLTQDQYDALPEYDADTLYFIVPVPVWHFGEPLPATFNKTT